MIYPNVKFSGNQILYREVAPGQKLNLIVLLLYQVVNGAVMDTDPERSSSYKPALGKSWISVPHTRLYFEPMDNTGCVSKSCLAVLTKSNRQVRHLCVPFEPLAADIPIFLSLFGSLNPFSMHEFSSPHNILVKYTLDHEQVVKC